MTLFTVEHFQQNPSALGNRLAPLNPQLADFYHNSFETLADHPAALLMPEALFALSEIYTVRIEGTQKITPVIERLTLHRHYTDWHDRHGITGGVLAFLGHSNMHQVPHVDDVASLEASGYTFWAPAALHLKSKLKATEVVFTLAEALRETALIGGYRYGSVWPEGQCLLAPETIVSFPTLDDALMFVQSTMSNHFR